MSFGTDDPDEEFEREDIGMDVNGTFRFHNIGQGLFYSGILSKREKKSTKPLALCMIAEQSLTKNSWKEK